MAAVIPERYDLLSPEHLTDPYPLYAKLRDASRVHWSESLDGWAVTRYRDVQRAISDDDLSAARFSPYLERLERRGDADPDDKRLYEALARWFTFADPPEHTRLRSVTRRVFSAPMKAMREPVERMVDEVLDRAASAGEFDIIEDVARPVSVGAIAELLGVPRSDHGLFTAWSDVLTDFIGGALNVPDRRRRALEGMSGLSAYLDALIKERRRHPTSDVIGGLAQARRDEDRLDDEEIAAIGAMLLFAGHGTTTNLIGNGVRALLGHRDELDRLRSEPKLLQPAVEELLRYDSPVQITVRIAKHDGALETPDIRAGDRVFLFLAAANHDPSEFDVPARLDVGRPNVRHLSFGYGIHFCLGAPLARIEAPILFGRLLRRFPDLALAVDEDELAWQPTVGFRGLQRLPVTVG